MVTLLGALMAALPLAELRKALTDGKDSDRVIVLIDELDRCHPDYALALLEAMKLVFNLDGFVFVLMVNADHLERLAAHRFGAVGEGERYIGKFVDLRLQLPRSEEWLSNAVFDIAKDLPLAIPFGDGPEFGVERAARLASQIAPKSGLSIQNLRSIKCLKMLTEFRVGTTSTTTHPAISGCLMRCRGFRFRPTVLDLCAHIPYTRGC